MTAAVTPVYLFRLDLRVQKPMLVIPVGKESSSISLKQKYLYKLEFEIPEITGIRR